MFMSSRSLRTSIQLHPLQITPEGQIIIKISNWLMLDDGHYLIRLQAKISPPPPRPSSSISVRFKLEDNIKVITSLSQTETYQAFDCPLSSKPFVCTFTTEASGFRPLKIETNDYPVKREDLGFFEQVLNCFVAKISRSLRIRCSIDIEATAFIRRVLWYEEAMDIIREVEGGGVKKESGEPGDECGDCAVCLDVVRLGWFDGLRLPCRHVFHFNCIASWFQLKDSCPICRRSFS